MAVTPHGEQLIDDQTNVNQYFRLKGCSSILGLCCSDTSLRKLLKKQDCSPQGSYQVQTHSREISRQPISWQRWGYRVHRDRGRGYMLRYTGGVATGCTELQCSNEKQYQLQTDSQTFCLSLMKRR